MKLDLKVGDIILLDFGGFVEEIEVNRISECGEYYKIGKSWRTKESLSGGISCRVGTAKYKKGLFGTRRTVTYHSESAEELKRGGVWKGRT